MATHGELAEALLVISATFGTGTTRHGELAEIKLQTATSTRHGELAEISLVASSGTSVRIDPISDVRIQPLTTGTITATLTGGGTADSWTFTQTGGPTVAFSGSGNSRTFTAPPTVEGTSVLIQVDATLGGVAADSILARFLVYPQQQYRKKDDGWYAVRPTRVP